METKFSDIVDFAIVATSQRQQSHDVVDAFVAEATFFVKEFAHSAAQARGDAADEIRHLLARKGELAFEVAVGSTVDGVTTKDEPRAIASFGDKCLLDFIADLREDCFRPCAFEGGGGIWLRTFERKYRGIKRFFARASGVAHESAHMQE